jgi:hypothetical protein
VLRAGTLFAIVQGTDRATMHYPPTQRMAVADAETKAEAKQWIARMTASGGTRMGTWLTCAHDLFAAHSDAIRHAVLLTDGHGHHESPRELDRALDACAGQFFCDARGIGDDWDQSELERVVDVLRGTAHPVGPDSELVDDFRAMLAATMVKVVPDLRIKVTTKRGAELRLLKQVYPRELDVTGNPERKQETTDGKIEWEFSTGSWVAHDSRDFRLALGVARDARDPRDKDLEIATIELVARSAGTGGAAPSNPQRSILVQWTDDPSLPSRRDQKVAYYDGQAEMHKAALAGFDAYDADRFRAAAREWGKAVQIATAYGNTELLTRLERLVEIIDADQGIVRIKPDLSHEDLLRAAAGSSVPHRFPGEPRRKSVLVAGEDSRPNATVVRCTNCDRILPGYARFCGKCGARLGEQSR